MTIAPRFVYAIRAGETSHIKVGYSKAPSRRLRQLQSGCPQKLRLVATAETEPAMEALLHQLFAERDRRVEGEWFDVDDLDDDDLRDLFAVVAVWLRVDRPVREQLARSLRERMAERRGVAA